MQLIPYLFFDGQCEAAFKLYAQVLRGEVTAMMHYADAPSGEEMPADSSTRIMHASLTAGDQVLMGSDACPPQHPYQRPQGMSVSLDVDTVAEAERIFNGLSDGATVMVPLEKTFFAARWGMLIDRYGTPWMIHCDKET